MIRKITVKIETDSEESFDLIKNDIEQELSCCWNRFDKVEICEDDRKMIDTSTCDCSYCQYVRRIRKEKND